MGQIILSLDPASIRNCGFCVAEIENGTIRIITSGNEQLIGEWEGQTLSYFEDWLSEINRKYYLNQIVFELPCGLNRKTLINLAQFCGIIKKFGYREVIELYQYAPTSVKKTITGSGRASKQMVMTAVAERFIDQFPMNYKFSEHQADAIANLYHHQITRNII